MCRSLKLLYLACLLVPAASATVRAQYYPDPVFPAAAPHAYVGWGSTVVGDAGRGMGTWMWGAGQYEYNAALAATIHAQRIRFIQVSLWQDQAVRNHRYAQLQMVRRGRNIESYDSNRYRVANTPDPRDVELGSSLNALLAQLSEPGVYPENLAPARVQLAAAAIRDLPLGDASLGASTLSFAQVRTSGLPASYRGRWGTPDDSEPFVRYVERLYSSGKTPLGDLLELMKSHRLRFAPARTPQQREAYRELYARLRALRDAARPDLLASIARD